LAPDSTFQAENFQLKNGLTVTIRSIRKDDAPRLQALLGRLSQETIFLRFLQYLKSLTSQEAEALATVDYYQRMAIVATREKNGEEQVIAVARYTVFDQNQPNTAEIGIVVEDAYQNQGLGSYLLDELTRYAKASGIRFFVSTISAQNSRILHFIRRSGLPTERKLDLGTWEIRVQLDDNPANES
jgi:RimJ/RimL family protein N-acetyltransferase